MITISTEIQLAAINLEDQPALYQLMKRIYPPAYEHLWKDDGSWYIDQTFNQQILENELAESNAAYYFVVYQNCQAGILRIVWDAPFVDFPQHSAFKLHRLYLGTEAQGKGVAKGLMDWVEQQAIQHHNELVWLDVMDTQQQALKFYTKTGFQRGSSTRHTFDLMHEHYRGMYRMWKNLEL